MALSSKGNGRKLIPWKAREFAILLTFCSWQRKLGTMFEVMLWGHWSTFNLTLFPELRMVQPRWSWIIVVESSAGCQKFENKIDLFKEYWRGIWFPWHYCVLLHGSALGVLCLEQPYKCDTTRMSSMDWRMMSRQMELLAPSLVFRVAASGQSPAGSCLHLESCL